MTQPLAAQAGDLVLMVIASADLELGIEATRVQEVVPLEKWTGPAPLDVNSLVGGATQEGAGRILRVARRDGEPLILRTSGTVRLRQVPRAQAFLLPDILVAYARWISHVVLIEGQAPLLVVDPDLLGG